MSSYKVPWTFKTWIESFKNVDLPIGDLADDILRDKEFPRDSNDFHEILEYLYEKTGIHVIEAFCDAWNYYIVSTTEPSDIRKRSQQGLS